MAKKKTNQSPEKKSTGSTNKAKQVPVLEQDLRKDYELDSTSIEDFYQGLDEKEAILVSKIQESSGARSSVTDSRIATIALEGSGRVMRSMPRGTVKALSLKDKGKSVLMDIILQRYVMQNADAQHDHLIKLRLWNLYSRVYGAMPMLYDYDIRSDYVGPESWLVPIRNFTPQRGKVSIQDSDYVHIDNYVSPTWLKKRIEEESSTWNKDAVNKVLKMHSDSEAQRETGQMSFVERERVSRIAGNEIRIRTRYESGDEGKWVTFAPDHGDIILREIDNPHETGRIPVVMKYCYPLMDSIFGLGDFERGKTLQYAMDSLVNLYLDSVKMSIYPPTIINPNGVVPSSIKFGPGERWLETQHNSIRPYQVSPQGMDTFQNTYNFLIGALMNQNGTTDTSINEEDASDPGFGKTPQALKMLQSRENTRDNMDRFQQERAIEELYNGMIHVMVNNQVSPIKIDLFDQEIEQIENSHPDVKDMVKKSDSGEYGQLKIDKSKIKDTRYRFFIEPNSTMEMQQEEKKEALAEILLIISKIPGLAQELQAEGKHLNYAELIKSIIVNSGIDNADDIIYRVEESDHPEDETAQIAQELGMGQQAQEGQPGDGLSMAQAPAAGPVPEQTPGGAVTPQMQAQALGMDPGMQQMPPEMMQQPMQPSPLDMGPMGPGQMPQGMSQDMGQGGYIDPQIEEAARMMFNQ